MLPIPGVLPGLGIGLVVASLGPPVAEHDAADVAVAEASEVALVETLSPSTRAAISVPP